MDIAARLDHDELVRAVREARFLRVFDLAAMQDVLAHRPCRVLRTLVEDLALTQSWLEDRMLDICDRHGIPRPLTQHKLLGHRMDSCGRGSA